LQSRLIVGERSFKGGVRSKGKRKTPPFEITLGIRVGEEPSRRQMYGARKRQRVASKAKPLPPCFGRGVRVIVGKFQHPDPKYLPLRHALPPSFQQHSEFCWFAVKAGLGIETSSGNLNGGANHTADHISGVAKPIEDGHVIADDEGEIDPARANSIK
jgi:hypothetical protein